MRWTDERIAALTKLWRDGRSASQIAAEMGDGITRNAVVGKASRLGLGGHSIGRCPKAKPPAAVPIKAAVAKAVPADPQLKGEPAPAAAPVKAAPPKLVPAPPQKLKGPKGAPPGAPDQIAALAEGFCCWSIGDPYSAKFRFCGEPAVLSYRADSKTPTYCVDHWRRAYQPPSGKRLVRPFPA